MKSSRTSKLKIFICLICTLAFCTAIFFSIRNNLLSKNVETISMKDALSDYDYMWEVLEENYPLLGVAERKYGLSMDALKANYRNQIEALGQNQIDFCEYYLKMRECIGKFKSLGHLSLLSPLAYQAYIAEAENAKQDNRMGDLWQWQYEQYQDQTVKARYAYLMEKYGTGSNGHIGSGIQASTENLIFKDVNEETGYVRINSFSSSNIRKDQDKLHAWFTENTDKKNIIIDITGNGGGSDNYWLYLIVIPNIDDTITYTSYYITPYGEGSREQFTLKGIGTEDLNPNLNDLLKLPNINKDDLSKAKYYVERTISVEPEYDKKVCSGRFFLLVDENVYSAADGFAQFCKATGFATVVGKETAGDGGGADVFMLKLPKSGLILRYRAMHGLNADGSSNVEFGTTPDVVYAGTLDAKKVSYLNVCLDYIDDLDE